MRHLRYFNRSSNGASIWFNNLGEQHFYISALDLSKFWLDDAYERDTFYNWNDKKNKCAAFNCTNISERSNVYLILFVMVDFNQLYSMKSQIKIVDIREVDLTITSL